MIKLQVGKKTFEVGISTLKYSNSTYFQGLVDERFKIDADVFIDRDDTHFDLILSLLRNGSDPLSHEHTLKGFSIIDLEKVRNECKFYGMDEVVSFVNKELKPEPIIEQAIVTFRMAPSGSDREEMLKLAEKGFIYKRQEKNNGIIVMIFERVKKSRRNEK